IAVGGEPLGIETSSHPPPALHSFAHGGSGSRLAWPNASVAPIGVDTQRLDASAWALSAPRGAGGWGGVRVWQCPSSRRFPGCHSYCQQSPQTPLALLADALDRPAEPP